MTTPLLLVVVAALALSVTTATAMGASHKRHADTLTIGFVTHAVGDPFIKQILQAAKDAGKDLGVNVKTTGTPAFDPAGQLKMVQDLFASGADGVATSITGDSKAPYVGERSVGDWALLGKAVRAKMGSDANGATAIIGTCAPGFPALVDRINGVKKGLGAGVKIKGPYDVTGAPTTNYSRWQQLIAANPDAKALIGVCAQDLATLGKLNKDKKYITAGGDPTIGNIAALTSGAGLISMGQTGYVQGYLPVKMIVDAIRSKKALPKSGFISSGFEIITATGSKEDHGLPPLPIAKIKGFQTNSAAQKTYYHQLFFGKGKFVNWSAHVEPIANASR
jgi:ABC-type sugar transport system substrate-binding protein